jgi:hypothetical protein
MRNNRGNRIISVLFYSECWYASFADGKVSFSRILLYGEAAAHRQSVGGCYAKVWVLEWVVYHRSKISTRRLDGAMRTLAVYIRYDLSAPHRNILSQPQVWPVSRGQTGALRLWNDSSVHCFASAVVAGASIAGLRGEY